MPTNLRCKKCGARYYTAVDRERVTSSECEKCGGKLEVDNKGG